MAGVDSAMDPIFSPDSLILDPLDLAGIDGQILSDNNPVADQATEDSFRSDHLWYYFTFTLIEEGNMTWRTGQDDPPWDQILGSAWNHLEG